MTFLAGQRVAALDTAADGALARFLTSLGAELIQVDPDSIVGTLPHVQFLIDGEGLESLSARGIELSAAREDLIHISISPFGSFGPRAAWRGGELVASAAGGTLRVTGYPDRAPVKEAADACWFHAEMAAAAGAMAAYRERGISGKGQHVDISVQEVALSRNVNGILVWQFDRRKLHRVGGALNYGRATVRCIWDLADGYCFHSLMTGSFGAPANQALSDWMDAVGLPNPLAGTDWRSYNRSTLPAETRQTWESAIAAFFKTRTKNEIRTDGKSRGINATVVNTPEDVLQDTHLAERNFLDGADPRRFVRISEGAATAAVRAPAASDRTGPLAGLRVLDFAWALVGSTTTKILGDLGADVIKVESRGRPCLTRIDVQVSASRADSFDDKPWYAHLNTSKRSLALDMKKESARDVLDPLIRWADVVVENFSPGTMAKLGLDYTSLATMNPGLVMISGSVFGQTGSMAQEWGVDGTGGALSGRTFLTGFADRPPVIPGAVPYGDVILPYAMAAAVAAAVEARRTSGRGCHIDASMYEICVQQMRDALLAAGRGETPARTGNSDALVRRQGVYPVSGEDRWVAISLFDETDVARFEALTGIEANDEAIAAWSFSQNERALVEMLQQGGIAAAVVQDVEDLLDHDPQIAAREALIPMEHPLLGTFGHLRTPMRFSRSVPDPFRAPSIGEHGETIAREIAGLSSERIAAMAADGVFR